jgi:hypothetical protein
MNTPPIPSTLSPKGRAIVQEASNVALGVTPDASSPSDTPPAVAAGSETGESAPPAPCVALPSPKGCKGGTPPPVFLLHLTPTGSGPATDQRLRHVLKLALRVCCLRCTKVAEVKG